MKLTLTTLLIIVVYSIGWGQKTLLQNDNNIEISYEIQLVKT